LPLSKNKYIKGEIMYFLLTPEEVKFLKKQLPSIRLTGYDIDKFQNIMRSLDNPIKAITESSNNSILPLTTIGSTIKNNPTQKIMSSGPSQVLISDPVQYDDSIDNVENNSFLKPPTSTQQQNKKENVFGHRLIKQNVPIHKLHKAEDNYEATLERIKEEQYETIEDESVDEIYTEEEPTQEIQTEPENAIFNNVADNIETASIFSVVDSRTKK
jgi:hypothetical protein